MVLHFQKTLKEALQEISFREYQEFKSYHGFVIHDKEEAARHNNEFISKYGDAKWAIVDMLNKKFANNFDLINWLHYNENDELAYFLNEAGSNSLSHSEFKAPYKFHLWTGNEGFVVGIEQKGKGFDAQEVNEKFIMDNEGAAFDFFRRCRGQVFFDNCCDARVIYFQLCKKFR